MVFEVDSGNPKDLFINPGHGDEAEDCDAIVGAVGGFQKRGLSAVARLRRWRDGVKKALERNSGFHSVAKCNDGKYKRNREGVRGKDCRNENETKRRSSI